MYLRYHQQTRSIIRRFLRVSVNGKEAFWHVSTYGVFHFLNPSLSIALFAKLTKETGIGELASSPASAAIRIRGPEINFRVKLLI